ncbi:MAG: sigma-70 family RNA polymerase sigma factor [Actinomycetota bacterium]|nr:sigma-70 family RNA polymerase sigma factor [Actinomycetota bacterium]
MPNLTKAITDEELIGRMAAGEEAALAELHARHHRTAYAIALRALADRALAEDAVQEAFLDLWRGSARWDPARAKLSTWICVLAHRRAVDIARREARRETAPEQAETWAADAYTTEELVVLREDRRDVQSALEQLTATQRNVIELAYYGGLSQVQIARTLEIPLGTVKSRVFEALSSLRELLPAPHLQGAIE